jgi:hypothetical protein
MIKFIEVTWKGSGSRVLVAADMVSTVQNTQKGDARNICLRNGERLCVTESYADLADMLGVPRP